MNRIRENRARRLLKIWYPQQLSNENYVILCDMPEKAKLCAIISPSIIRKHILIKGRETGVLITSNDKLSEFKEKIEHIYSTEGQYDTVFRIADLLNHMKEQIINDMYVNYKGKINVHGQIDEIIYLAQALKENNQKFNELENGAFVPTAADIERVQLWQKKD